ncbi:MAG: hypothetical protein K6C09_09890 [Oscillospiraceae bacterium]|jgi:hypothetical protein|nr:hypothetical protein [Oscillospiraceae bacterium]
MIFNIYAKAMAVLVKKPFVLWGISLLQIFLAGLAWTLFGIIPGVAMCLGWLLSTSMTLIFLHGYRGNRVNVLMLFDCFRDWSTIKRVLCGMGWMNLWIFLWALIPVVGWIFALIRVYRYRLTPYILMQEPNVAPTDAIKLSRERTEGWKSRMFGADVLIVVAVYVVVLILGLLARIRYIGALFGIILFLFAIACFAFLPLFIGLVRAAFYEEIKAEANGSSRCPACGTYVHSKSAFCQNCGAPLHADPRTESPSAPAITEPEPPAAPPEEAVEEAEQAVLDTAEEIEAAADAAENEAEQAAEAAEEAVEQATEEAASAAEDAEQALKDAEDAASDMLDEFNPEN